MRAQHLCRKKDCFTVFKRRTKCKKFICCPKKKRRFVPAFGTAITDPPLIFTVVDATGGILAGTTPFANFQPVVAENVNVESAGIRVLRCGGAASLSIVVAALVALTGPLQIALTRNGTIIPGTETTIVPTGVLLATVGATFTAEIPERNVFLNAGELIDLAFINAGAAVVVGANVTGVLGVGRVSDTNCFPNGFNGIGFGI